MISLFIDTSLKNVSIALLRDSEIISIIQEDIPNEHSKYATLFIDRVIREAEMMPKDIERIYVVNGPGSFTGVRIGVTIAKTFSYLRKIEVIAVSSLKAIVLSSNRMNNVMSIIPATRNNYYVAVYDSNLFELYNESFTTIDKIYELINKYNPQLISTEIDKFKEINVEKIKLNITNIIEYYKDKPSVNPHKLVPNYLKLPQAMEEKND